MQENYIGNYKSTTLASCSEARVARRGAKVAVECLCCPIAMLRLGDSFRYEMIKMRC